MLPLDCLFFTVAKLLVIVWMNEWMSFLCHTQTEPQDIRPIRTIWQHYSYTDSTHKKLSVMSRSCTGPKSDGSWKQHFPLLRLRLGAPSASNRFATLEVMNIILVKTKYHYITIILNTWILRIWTVYIVKMFSGTRMTEHLEPCITCFVSAFLNFGRLLW